MLTSAARSPLPPVAVAFVAANAALFAFTHDMTRIGDTSLRRNALVDWATYAFPIAEVGEWWRLGTGAFLHADIRHLILNLVMFFLLGRRLEKQLGSPLFAAICLNSMLWGSAGALVAAPNTAVVGASGIVYGIMASVYVVERLSGRDPWSEGLGTLIVVNVVLSFVVPGISVGGHLGGLVGGLLAGWAAGDQRRRSPIRVWIALPLLGIFGFALGLIAAGTWMDPLF
ncbi:MAG: hypothetical protein CL464_10680 [Acidimicrobiaceae bacterium]|nr:hypothetical protein [Acidimicrobiaceae bacterium]MCS5673822.1 rhomboid family intramembrane serine protease [Acidimicrobiales bacterium]MEE2806282.1 rhomboid family intramembrane serine protease [Actinomycetota bacterium]